MYPDKISTTQGVLSDLTPVITVINILTDSVSFDLYISS